MIDRPQYLRALRRWKDKQMIKVITGIRRCGKSTLMELFQAELRLDGVPDSQIIAVNLEDFANIELRDPMKLHAYILSRAGNERAYVFLDEIQNVRDFPPMIDSLFLQQKSGSLPDRLERLHAVRRAGDASFPALCHY